MNNIKIIDAHVHFGIDYYLNKIKGIKKINLGLAKLLKMMDKNKVRKSIVFHCPSIRETTCCEPCELIKEKDKIISKCPKCKKTIKILDNDPYRKYNLKLIKFIEKNNLKKRLVPFVILHMQNPLMKEEIEFFRKRLNNFPVWGIKFHTVANKRSILDLSKTLQNYDIPLLVHSGPEKQARPENLMKFAKKYSGKILMAHGARYSPRLLKRINKIPNLYVDTSPLTSFFNRIKRKDFSTILGSPKYFRKIRSPEDLYSFILRYLDSGKILFGTDAPWCDEYGLGYEEEVKALLKAGLTEDERERIAYKNCRDFLKKKN